MQEQPSFKVTWIPYDHRMIIRLTSESLQTQTSGHLMTKSTYTGRRTTIQGVRCGRVATQPIRSSHDQTGHCMTNNSYGSSYDHQRSTIIEPGSC